MIALIIELGFVVHSYTAACKQMRSLHTAYSFRISFHEENALQTLPMWRYELFFSFTEDGRMSYRRNPGEGDYPWTGETPLETLMKPWFGEWSRSEALIIAQLKLLSEIEALDPPI